MKYAAQHLSTAAKIIADYNGDLPLHHFLKTYFSTQKKFGSKDRKNISHLCYSYFRLGHALKNSSSEDRIIIVLFLSGANDWKNIFPEEWQAMDDTDFNQRIAAAKIKYPLLSIKDIFSFKTFSPGLNLLAFIVSHLYQPKVFMRIRNGRENSVNQKLLQANLPFEKISNTCFAFTNNTRLETILTVNEDYVVQDYNSQRIGEWMADAKSEAMDVWDCCAASGGKSIMAVDLLPIKNLLVTDIRASIIKNLRQRFKEAGIKNYTGKVVDATDNNALLAANGKQRFDLVICDAPCSGSGTWGRTPEQLFYFTCDKIDYYAKLQKMIAFNAMGFVKTGGYFLYITCSVFREENEDEIEFLKNSFNVELVKMELLQGYSLQADTMFAALLKKLD